MEIDRMVEIIRLMFETISQVSDDPIFGTNNPLTDLFLSVTGLLLSGWKQWIGYLLVLFGLNLLIFKLKQRKHGH